jgi:hypothetical protein
MWLVTQMVRDGDEEEEGLARRARRFLRKYVLFLSEVMRHCSAPYSDAGVECWRLLPQKTSVPSVLSPCPPCDSPLHSHR